MSAWETLLQSKLVEIQLLILSLGWHQVSFVKLHESLEIVVYLVLVLYRAKKIGLLLK
jgi:hypothetical protein